MNQFGHNFRLAIWGESHGHQIGISLDGVPAGIPLSEEDFAEDLARRRSGAPGTTPRREPDVPQIVSGVYDGYTTGAPLTIEFANTNTHSQDYSTVMRHYRPSHADLVAYHKFAGFNDPRGGGHFSARLTVALVAAGVVAKKMLPASIRFATRLTEIGGCTDPERFNEVLHAAAADRDSVGGIVECRVQGVPLGLGQPFFDSAESMIAHLLFAVPAVKGVEFGSGFAGARLRGSENNDSFTDCDGTTATNNAGGINGGITNGNEIVVRAALKPTPSIGREQITYNLATNRVEPLEIHGRHDVCVALRGAVVVEAAVAIALATGGTLGAIAGYFGGVVDNVIMRVMDVFLSIPILLLAIMIVAALGSSMTNLMIAIGLASMPTFARVVRASVLSVKDQEFVEAARAIGATNGHIILRHILPNCLSPIIVQATLRVATAILSTASLSFIGLGIKPPAPEWGAMLASGRSAIRDAPHVVVIPGLVIMITILALNLLGDGLRDALDPKLKR